MTVPARESPESPRAPEAAPVTPIDPPWPGHEPSTPPGPISVGDICPYLVAASGSWRSSAPSRSHRCGAVDPPGGLPAEKQRRHCLSLEHANCQVFRAARASRAAVLAPGIDPSAVAVADAARRPLARTAAVVLEQARFGAPAARWPLNRALSQAALVGLMVVAFAVVALTRLSSSDGAGPSQSPLASPLASASASVAPTRRPTPSPSSGASGSPGVSGSPVASAAPSASAAVGSPSASASTTYRVKSGDTLVGIAGEFGTTVPALKELNGLTSNDLRVGQLLKIP